jgi:hypothetical protein
MVAMGPGLTILLVIGSVVVVIVVVVVNVVSRVVIVVIIVVALVRPAGVPRRVVLVLVVAGTVPVVVPAVPSLRVVVGADGGAEDTTDHGSLENLVAFGVATEDLGDDADGGTGHGAAHNAIRTVSVVSLGGCGAEEEGRHQRQGGKASVVGDFGHLSSPFLRSD